MNTVYKITHQPHFITDSKGKIQSIILDAKNYEMLIELLENYGLGLAMKEALNDKKYNKKEALKFLVDD